MRSITLAAAFLSAIIVAVPALAGVIYDNGSADFLDCGFSDYAAGYQNAGDFVLATGSETITGIHWWGIYSNTQLVTDDFTIVIYGDNGGMPDPGDILFSLSAGDVGQTDTGGTIYVQYHVYEYSLKIDPLVLVAGNTYHLSIANNTGTWMWATSAQSGTTTFSTPPTFENFAAYPFEMAFNLTDDNVVPEPGTLTVTNPNVGGKWRIGKRQRIEWTSTGDPGPDVKIELLKNGNLVKTIKGSTANDGLQKWKVPSDVPTGNGYKVRIKSVSDPTISDESDSPFRLKPAR